MHDAQKACTSLPDVQLRGQEAERWQIGVLGGDTLFKGYVQYALRGMEGVTPPSPMLIIVVSEPIRRKKPEMKTSALPRITAARVLKKSFITVFLDIHTKIKHYICKPE